MTDLSPLCALGGRVARHGALSLTENAGLALASLALRRGAAEPVPFGLRLPGPGLCCAGQGLAAFWTGPGQWFIEATDRAETDFARDLAQHAPGCSVTEQTDGWVCFEIEGPGIPALMAKLVNIDTAAFGPGCATRTALEHMSVFVIRRAEERLAVLGMRSAAGSLWHALETAMERQGELT
ncbi:sarcosine oxidase subunit gamma [Paenirhodobacter sp.]|uniref:sarcosine oxidase subunit gamma n=1 Tax=Paenirhodobacter sp. TaxID=1965326 RepID=UPI003B3D8CD0